ncbi:phosphate ABC transporter ATP-binding protein, PhoT family [Halothece sp. PCC 7418]|uniref:phosphate ABC transporter ATP-binding protein PstB n=1 Tax=Halothece sp. (strain PCC 7418) TaxID=65093 RepID=UPI0002A06FFC|nr:phosphate ABC transporter ATP-binding protein PstB [Halothece sp. PCC 7418]AFZ44079.1 phosphate ABC transporter ATP-binding protein, PhoT family [Halothece sp. PCC 7418]
MQSSSVRKPQDIVLQASNVSVYYSGQCTLHNINLEIPRHNVVGLIGPSGCGKSTLLRSFNRLNDLVKGAKVTGLITLNGRNIHDEDVNPVTLRQQVGMVFQRPNPFPKSIYNNIAVGLRVNGYQGDKDELVEYSLRQVGLWDEVKDRLKKNALTLSGGQQQRLCIARAIALQPEVILMDEPCSALDPISTARVEELIRELQKDYTLIIVTHNLKQASLVCDRVAFFDLDGEEQKSGRLVEYDRTEIIFQRPSQSATQEYVTGRRMRPTL